LTIYPDTSFLVSLYLDDRHSAEAQRWLKSELNILLTRLHVAEFTHAIEQHAFRGELSVSESRALHELLLEDIANSVWIEASIPESAYDRCIDLARHYASQFGSRTLDSLHVASALELNTTEFWTFDDRQKKLARAAGLKVR